MNRSEFTPLHIKYHWYNSFEARTLARSFIQTVVTAFCLAVYFGLIAWVLWMNCIELRIIVKYLILTITH